MGSSPVQPVIPEVAIPTPCAPCLLLAACYCLRMRLTHRPHYGVLGSLGCHKIKSDPYPVAVFTEICLAEPAVEDATAPVAQGHSRWPDSDSEDGKSAQVPTGPKLNPRLVGILETRRAGPFCAGYSIGDRRDSGENWWCNFAPTNIWPIWNWLLDITGFSMSRSSPPLRLDPKEAFQRKVH